MGITHHSLPADWFRIFSRRIRKAPSRLAHLRARGAELRGKLNALGLLVASLAFGILGARFSQEQALLRWQRENLPPSRVWEASLEAFSFRKLEKLSFVHRVLRTLPVQFDPAGGYWVASENRWIVVTNPGSTEPLIFTVFEDSELHKNPSQFPSSEDWSPGEPGWPGFQALLANLDASPVRQTELNANPAKKKPATWRDPMEIIF